MFSVAIHIALKMSIKVITSCKRPLPTLTNLHFRMVQQKNPKEDEKIATFWAQKLLKMTCQP